MKVFRIMYLDDRKKQKRIIVEATDQMQAYISAACVLSMSCQIYKLVELSDKELQKMRFNERKELHHDKRIKIIPKRSIIKIYPEFIFKSIT